MLLFLLPLAMYGQGQANLGGVLFASNFTGWSVPQGNNGNYNWTSNTFCIVSAGGLTFNAFTVGVPVYLADTSNPSTSETVTPTAVVINNSGCSIRINPANQHQSFYFRTATAGLGEAIGYANNQNFVVALTPQWQQLGGITSMITTSIGNYNVSIIDQRTSVAQPYTWNGTQYVANGSAACSGGCVTSIGVQGSPLTNNVVLAPGSNVSINQLGQTITISSTGGGGGGGGDLGTLPYDLLANNPTNTGQVDLYDFYSGSGFTPQQAYNAASANNGSFTLTPTGGRVPFTSTGNVRAYDARSDVPATAIGITEAGAVCDLRSIYGTFSSGSKSFTLSTGSLTSADIGKTLVAVGSVSGTPTAFESVVTAASGSAGTVTTNFPFNQSTAHQMDLGHDDTTAIENTMTAVGGGGTLVFPEGVCLTHTQTIRGQSPIGLGVLSMAASFPGEDIFAAPDPSSAGGVNQGAAHIHDLTFLLDSRIDATQPWQIISDSGTTAKAALYRPIAQKTGVSNDPVAPGWFQGGGPNLSGATNGVANITASSAVICTPNAITSPTVGMKIVFPYLSSIYTGTVSSTGGSCSGGFTARTLSSPLPTGSTNTQAEWFSGTNPQNLSTSISSSSCPSTITLSNSINPVAGYESNVAPFGLIQIDGEQFSYFGRSSAANPSPANTLYGIQCAQNGTARASHASSATVVPLNLYKPSYPWPVTPTVNSGDTTPTGTASYFPGWNVGNAAFAFPLATGSSPSYATGAWTQNAKIENLSFFPWPNDINGASWTEVNHTAMMYAAYPSYATTFSNLYALYLFYGVAFGGPSIENGNWATAQPTADGSHWDGITLYAANPVNIPYGNENTFSNFNVYSNEATLGGSGLGADTCMFFSSLWNDQTGGIAQALSLDHFKNMYCEPESGSHAGIMPNWEWDTFNSEIEDQHMGGGGEVYIGGNQQHWIGGNFNQSASSPAINWGSGNTSDYAAIMGLEPKSNVYGSGALINYGVESNFSGQTSTVFGTPGGPYGGLQAVGSRMPIPSQTMETFNTGNVTAPYTSSAGGLIYPNEFNLSGSFETQPMSAYAYDSTSPVTAAYAGCNVGTSGTTTYCNPVRFNQSQISIGPGQRIAAGKYEVYVSAKDQTTATNSFNLIIGATCSLTNGPVTSAVPITNAWPTSGVFKTQMDFTGASPGCGIAFAIEGAMTADQVQIGYIAFSPLPENFQVANLTAGKMTDTALASSIGQCVKINSDGSFTTGACGGSGGGVSSVSQTVPSWLTVTGSPVTGSGTLAIAPATGQTAHQVIGTCGSATTFTPCALTAADIPTLPYLANPMTTLGDTISFSTIPTRIAGNTVARAGFYSETGNGTISATPTWVDSSGTGIVCLTVNCQMTTPDIGAATGASLNVRGPYTGIFGSGAQTFTAGSTTVIGSGGSYSAPVATTGVAADSFGGSVSFTTGAGISAAGVIFTIQMPNLRTLIPSCTINIKGGTVALGEWVTGTNSSGTVTLSVGSNVALTNNTPYQVNMAVCDGK